ncbi:MAG: cryptochrome/photolyase family protein [Schleiferiaceae bacterium]|nr:cryptochrome/photolyase family protein [Schleiferiaceae bacterium]MDR9441621.1 cryptochrome/photolyase family protein [Schleiferiaceae bacterium]
MSKIIRRLALVLGDQLFPDHQALEPDEATLFFMAEDLGLCTHYQYHQQKLVLFLSAMRQYAWALGQKYPVQYWKLHDGEEGLSYEDKLAQCLSQNPGIEELVTYRIDDAFMERRIRRLCAREGLVFKEVENPKFLFPLADFDRYLQENKKPFLHTYYQRQRKALGVLVDKEGKPRHGQWSFDADNRKKLPKNATPPEIPKPEQTPTVREVIELVRTTFPQHPGDAREFAWATTAEEVSRQFHHFLAHRFQEFGPYEDAFEPDQVFLYHSVLSPYLNIGLITPSEVLEKSLAYAEQNAVNYASLEGFVRQIMGWREFLRGMYHRHELTGNHFGLERKLTASWYDGTTGIPPLDDTIKKAQKNAYSHHIERLMVAGNIMLMAGLHPDEAYRWFMEMYIDSADWVMVPNVYGMSQFAEGGTFATKPYISGSNYLRKMSHYGKGAWCDVVDGLYWRFIDQKRDTFEANARMGMMLATLNKMDAEKKDRIFTAAENWIDQHTQRP